MRTSSPACACRPERSAAELRIWVAGPPTCLLALTFLAAASTFAQAPPGNKGPLWWNDGWTHRKLVQLQHVSDRPASPWAAVGLSTLGVVREDGADIRVVDEDGHEVPRALLSMGFEDRVQVAFEAAKPDGRYWIYLGNPRATPPRDEPEVKAGLVLEVRELGSGRCNTWDEFSHLLANSPTVMGRGLAARPMQGFNPYGRGHDYIAIFTGWLFCPEDGEYTFATNSWDGSFVCLDGQPPVAQFPGWHGPDGGNASHQGKVNLVKGVHKFEYFNCISNRGQGCAAGWKHPGAERIEPIAPQAFVGGSRGNVIRVERRGEPLVADFDWNIPSDLGTDDREVTAVQFRNASAVTDPKTATFEWDFGDGVTATGPNPLHVYLENNTYAVRLKVAQKDGKTATVTMKVRVRPYYSQGIEGYDRRIREYFTIVKEYPVSQLTPRAALFLGYIAYETEHSEEAVNAWGTMFVRHPAVDDRLVLDACFLLADLYRDEKNDADRALEVLKYLADQTKDEIWRVKALAKSAEILIDLKNDPKAAEPLLKEVVERHKGARTDYVRFANIQLGELYLVRGERDKARKALDEVQNGKQFKIAFGDISIQEGDHEVAFDEYLERKDYAAARGELAALEWSLPLSKMTGNLNMMKADLAVAEHRYERAILELERLPVVNPESNRIPESLVVLGQCYAALGKKDKARAAWERVIAEHPMSTERKEAEKRLAALGK